MWIALKMSVFTFLNCSITNIIKRIQVFFVKKISNKKYDNWINRSIIHELHPQRALKSTQLHLMRKDVIELISKVHL